MTVSGESEDFSEGRASKRCFFVRQHGCNVCSQTVLWHGRPFIHNRCVAVRGAADIEATAQRRAKNNKLHFASVSWGLKAPILISGLSGDAAFIMLMRGRFSCSGYRLMRKHCGRHFWSWRDYLRAWGLSILTDVYYISGQQRRKKGENMLKMPKTMTSPRNLLRAPESRAC